MIINELFQLNEMATIGNPIDGYMVSVYDSEGMIPHLHFINNKGRKKARGKGVVNVPIRLDIPKYFHHGRYKSILNSNQIEILIKILSSKPNNPDSPYKTNFQEVIARWNEANNYWDESKPNYLSTNLKMPNYRLLNV